MVNNPQRRVRTLEFHTTKPNRSQIRWRYDISEKMLAEQNGRRGTPSNESERNEAKQFIEAWCHEASKITQPDNFPERK